VGASELPSGWKSPGYSLLTNKDAVDLGTAAAWNSSFTERIQRGEDCGLIDDFNNSQHCGEPVVGGLSMPEPCTASHSVKLPQLGTDR
jgi:hypothetical protein